MAAVNIHAANTRAGSSPPLTTSRRRGIAAAAADAAASRGYAEAAPGGAASAGGGTERIPGQVMGRLPLAQIMKTRETYTSIRLKRKKAIEILLTSFYLENMVRQTNLANSVFFLISMLTSLVCYFIDLLE